MKGDGMEYKWRKGDCQATSGVLRTGSGMSLIKICENVLRITPLQCSRLVSILFKSPGPNMALPTFGIT